MKKIGITGSIGSGKSVITRIFATLGVPVYDADTRAKAVMNESAELMAGMKALFGEEAYQNNLLDRKLIAARVFGNTSLLAQLNALVHPAVFKDFDDWCAMNAHHPYIVKEAALMFESDSYKQLDEVIVVTCPEALRIARAMQRDNISREAVLARMNNQLSQEEKLARGQHEIVNNEVQLLIPQVLALHKKFSGQL